MKKLQQLKNNPLKNNLKKIYQDISTTKKPNQIVKLLAVTKTHPQKTINKAINLGIQYFGENKVQEAEKKFHNKPKKIELHLIGHLQKNKIKRALKIFDVIQTIDSLQLAEKINEQADITNKQQRIYCQINIGNDPKKFGFSKTEILRTITIINNFKHIIIEGTMTILPYNLTNAENKKLYNKTRRLHNKIAEKIPTCKELSMGMSNDYKTAIECGATFVRIGTKLFGERE